MFNKYQLPSCFLFYSDFQLIEWEHSTLWITVCNLLHPKFTNLNGNLIQDPESHDQVQVVWYLCQEFLSLTSLNTLMSRHYYNCHFTDEELSSWGELCHGHFGSRTLSLKSFLKALLLSTTALWMVFLLKARNKNLVKLERNEYPNGYFLQCKVAQVINEAFGTSQLSVDC